MIKFNDIESAKERKETPQLSLAQEVKVIEKLNELIGMAESRSGWSEEDNKLLQDFVNNYQNMSHYVASTEGFVCTDEPDKIVAKESDVLSQLSFK